MPRRKTAQPSDRVPEFVPKTEGQGALVRAILAHPVTFALGPAGTGKTFVAASVACGMLVDGEVERIVVTRPALPAGEDLGFLPGALDAKFAPYFAPIEQVFRERLGPARLTQALKTGQIVVLPLAFMRGWTFRDAFVLFDEAQNATPEQMRLFLTRLGEPVRVVVDGDPDQRDRRGPCGLLDAVARLESLPEVAVVRLGPRDIVRSALCARITAAYAESRATGCTLDRGGSA